MDRIDKELAVLKLNRSSVYGVVSQNCKEDLSMSYNVKITSETAEALVTDILIQDYRGVRSNIARLEARDDLEPFEQEDLANDTNLRAAMEVVLAYYLTTSQYLKVTSEPVL